MIFFEEIIQAASTSILEIGICVFSSDKNLIDSVCIYSDANKKTYLFDFISITYEQKENENNCGKQFFSSFAQYFGGSNVLKVAFDSHIIQEMLYHHYNIKFEALSLKV